ASSDRNSDVLHGRGYTCCSIRSTARRSRRRIGTISTLGVAWSVMRGSRGGSTIPFDLGVALAKVHRMHVPRGFELLALHPRGCQLHPRRRTGPRELGAGELDVVEGGELGPVAGDAVARQQHLVVSGAQV